MTGIAPASPVWKTGVLLLNYIPGRRKSESPRRAKPQRAGGPHEQSNPCPIVRQRFDPSPGLPAKLIPLRPVTVPAGQILLGPRGTFFFRKNKKPRVLSGAGFARIPIFDLRHVFPHPSHARQAWLAGFRPWLCKYLGERDRSANTDSLSPQAAHPARFPGARAVFTIPYSSTVTLSKG